MAKKWSTHLSRQWMQVYAEVAGTLYIDCHMLVYYDGAINCPKTRRVRTRLVFVGVVTAGERMLQVFNIAEEWFDGASALWLPLK